MRPSLRAQFTLQDIYGCSSAISRLKDLAVRAAKTDFPILLTGESGTGKELFAHAIHNLSRRAGAPFMAINCAAIPESLLESELFGYEAGAFTGASKSGKAGRLEVAAGGTVFLDEVGLMPLALQPKLLRLLQYGEIEKIGATGRLRVDVRVIAATNRPLSMLVAEGQFREDLYYRLNVIGMEIPPLRQRSEDIPVIAAAIMQRLNATYPELSKQISPEAMSLLQCYVWPGNVRELENLLQRLFALVDGQMLLPHHLGGLLPGGPWEGASPVASLGQHLALVEKDMIQEALRNTGGNKSQAARLLGVPRSSLYEKMNSYGLRKNSNKHR